MKMQETLVTLFFNSHPHKEDDLGCYLCDDSSDFSTHILTRRMTLICSSTLLAGIFQLTSSQGG